MEENETHFPGDREHLAEGQIGEDLLIRLITFLT